MRNANYYHRIADLLRWHKPCNIQRQEIPLVVNMNRFAQDQQKQHMKDNPMNNIFYFAAAIIISMTAQFSHADDSQCGKAYGAAVAFCAESLQALPANMRAGAQKACVADAKLAKEACMSGVNTCLNACQTTYENAVNTCNTNFDPAVCGGNLSCEAIVVEQRSICTSNAVTTLNSCTAACQL